MNLSDLNKILINSIMSLNRIKDCIIFKKVEVLN